MAKKTDAQKKAEAKLKADAEATAKAEVLKKKKDALNNSSRVSEVNFKKVLSARDDIPQEEKDQIIENMR